MSDDIFTCQQCGDCCRGYGGTFVSPADIVAIAAYIGSDPDGFVSDYCRMSAGRPLLAQAESGYCIFWNRTCTIHPVKPRMCRRWPFIPGLLADIRNWRVMADVCPGMEREAPEGRIRACVEAVLADETAD